MKCTKPIEYFKKRMKKMDGKNVLTLVEETLDLQTDLILDLFLYDESSFSDKIAMFKDGFIKK